MISARRHLLLDSRIGELNRLSLAIEDLCEQAGREEELPALALCAEELFTNIVVHGHGGEPGHPISVLLTSDDHGIEVELIDDAPAFDPTVPVAPDLDADVEDRAIGGLGRHLVSTLMDRFCYRREEGRNHVSFGRATRRGDETDGDRD